MSTIKLDYEELEKLRLYHFICWVATLNCQTCDMAARQKIFELCAAFISEYAETVK